MQFVANKLKERELERVYTSDTYVLTLLGDILFQDN